MRRFFKTAISVVLLAAALFSVAGCNRKNVEIEDEDCFEKFMDAICASDFAGAYGYLSEHATTAPSPAEETAKPEDGTSTAEPTPEPPAEYVTEKEFVDKYTAVFSGLELTSVSYEKLSEEKDGSDRLIKYYVTYSSKIAGELKNEYEMRLVVDGAKRRVDWTPALIFPDMTWGSTVKVSRVAAKRGDILAGGEILAETVSTDAIVADLDDIEDEAAFVFAAAEILGVPESEIIDKFDNAKSRNVLLAQFNKYEFDPDVREAFDNLTGARIIENYGSDRNYPQGELLAHTVGYVGYVEESELEDLNKGRTETDGLYTTHSIVGRSGIEKAYESVLRGKDGLTVTIRDAAGEYVSTIYKKPVEDGPDVHLTIDIALQKRAEEVMDIVLWGDDTAGSAVVMNPKTGEIKALVSYPSYDLNKIAISADKDYYEAISKQKNKPLQNRNTLGLYAPGSAMKVFTACAALELGVVGPDYVFTGRIVDDYWTPTQYGRWIWPPIKRTEIKTRTMPLNMANCLLHSDNIYFANLALMMGEEPFFNYLRGIGFEQKLPFDLSVARSTLKVKYDTEVDWNTRSIAETGYGQGQVTIAPLQLATMYCAFRNNGDMPLPRVTKALYRTEGIDYEPIRTFESGTWIEGAIQPETVATLEPMMENIMSRDYNGTGRFLRARNVKCAGKTGTAEIGSDKTREVSWVVAYRVDVPEEDELLVLVMLEIPTTDPYKHLKFDVARELISMEETITEEEQGVTP